VFIQKTHEQLQKIFQFFLKKISKPLPLFPPSLRLKETQAKPASSIPTERLQEISWQDFWRSHAPRFFFFLFFFLAGFY
jgi:hypothetical protein